MRMMTIAILLCGTALPALAQDQSAVRQASERFAAAMSGADAAAAASMFTDDAIALPPGRQEIRGKSSIQMFLNNMTRSVQDLKYTTEDIKPIGDVAARELGTFSFKTKGRNGNNPQDVSGKYVIVWERSGSDWKISTDMWNRNGNGQGKGGQRRKGGQGQGQSQDQGQGGAGGDVQ